MARANWPPLRSNAAHQGLVLIEFPKGFPQDGEIPQNGGTVIEGVVFKKRFRLPQNLLRRSVVVLDRNVGRSEEFPQCYRVSGGEKLKDLRQFPQHMEKILNSFDQINASPRAVVAIGGGSVGDFSGFVASVLKRGTEYHSIPTTWLSALDSAHGGKTALNVGSAKNQIGSFKSADQVWLFEDILLQQPEDRLKEAYYELVKIGLINSPALFKSIEQSKAFDGRTFFKLLPEAIEGKMKVVRKDPLEQKGLRHVLNLGHTFGHVLEGERGLTHGYAVGLGIRFAARWSHRRGTLNETALDRIETTLSRFELPSFRDIPQATFEGSLKRDKKRRGSRVRFIFPTKIGQVSIEEVTPQAVFREYQRQNK